MLDIVVKFWELNALRNMCEVELTVSFVVFPLDPLVPLE
jgi:hypothetical protein